MVVHPHPFKSEWEIFFNNGIISNKNHKEMVRTYPRDSREGALIMVKPLVRNKSPVKSDLNEIFPHSPICPGKIGSLELNIMQTLVVDKVQKIHSTF